MLGQIVRLFWDGCLEVLEDLKPCGKQDFLHCGSDYRKDRAMFEVKRTLLTMLQGVISYSVEGTPTLVGRSAMAKLGIFNVAKIA